jgi:hypothetical protein
MLRSVNSLDGFKMAAADGHIGKVKDFYFDDEAWVIRYVVVDSSAWLGEREVLISPYSIGSPDWSRLLLPIALTKEQIKNSPGIDTDKPISRQYERSHMGYYGYPYYWGGTGLWGVRNHPGTELTGFSASPDGAYQGYLRAPSDSGAAGDAHLRSCNAVKGYHIHATDGDIGHVQGFLADDSTWSIRYLIVDTSNWWVGHQVLVSPEWIHDVSWANCKVTVSLNRHAIRYAPAYNGEGLIDRAAEARIYNHYGRCGYWQRPSEGAVV